jgi:hypothetical protein
MTRLLIATISLAAACGGGNPSRDAPAGGDGPRIDAPPGSADARIDGPPGQPDADTGLSCATYCSTVMANCTAANLQFDDLADCLSSCVTWPPGDLSDTLGNTLGCRYYHAGVPATNNAGIHCPHAGPSGDGVCGTNCNGFCTLVQGVCTGGNQVYADFAACQSACNGFPMPTRYSANITSGDSYGCRLYHATKAATNPGMHCPHTAVISSTCQ